MKSGVLIENTRVWKGVSRFIRNTFIMHPSFVGFTQKVNRAKLIDDENILKRMSFLLTAVLQLPVNLVAWTANGTFYAVMDKKGGRIRRMRRFLMRRFFMQSLRQLVGSACREEVLR